MPASTAPAPAVSPGVALLGVLLMRAGGGDSSRRLCFAVNVPVGLVPLALMVAALHRGLSNPSKETP